MKTLAKMSGLLLLILMVCSMFTFVLADAAISGKYDTYTVSVIADVPQSIKAGSSINFKFDVQRDNIDGATSKQFYVLEGLSFEYDTDYYQLKATSSTPGFAVIDNAGYVTISTVDPDTSVNYTGADIPQITLVVKDSSKLASASSTVKFYSVNLLVAGNIKHDIETGYFNMVLRGDVHFVKEPYGISLTMSTRNVVTVQYDVGNKAAEIESVTLPKGSTISLPKVTPTDAKHYEFLGWSASPDGTVNSNFVASKDITLYAVFRGKEISIKKPNLLKTGDTPEKPGVVTGIDGEKPRYTEDFVGQIRPYYPDRYIYSVSYKNLDTKRPSTDVPVNEADGTFVIPGPDVTENLEITIIAIPITGDHVHRYNDVWSRDTSEHWHRCLGVGSGCSIPRIDIGSHRSDGGVITTKPTSSSTGVRTYSCKVCGYVMSTETLPRLSSGGGDGSTYVPPITGTPKPPVIDDDPPGFDDVPPTSPFIDDIEYVSDNGLMNGMSSSIFGYNIGTTRAMIATILYRMEGSPDAVYTAQFSDVVNDSWCMPGVEWCAAHGIVLGYADGTFKPNQQITRQQLCAMLYRYAEYKGYYTGSSVNLALFDDVSNVGDYAREAVAWGVGNNLIRGNNNNLLPRNTATRAQVAAVLHRFCDTFTT